VLRNRALEQEPADVAWELPAGDIHFT